MDSEYDRVVFRSFAVAHPHEAAEIDWSLFVALVREYVGWEIPEERVKAILRETSGEL